MWGAPLEFGPTDMAVAYRAGLDGVGGALSVQLSFLRQCNPDADATANRCPPPAAGQGRGATTKQRGAWWCVWCLAAAAKK